MPEVREHGEGKGSFVPGDGGATRGKRNEAETGLQVRCFLLGYRHEDGLAWKQRMAYGGAEVGQRLQVGSGFVGSIQEGPAGLGVCAQVGGAESNLTRVRSCGGGERKPDKRADATVSCNGEAIRGARSGQGAWIQDDPAAAQSWTRTAAAACIGSDGCRVQLGLDSDGSRVDQG